MKSPRQLFPKMPAEVHELWLDPLLIRREWNFNSVYESTQNTEWYKLFAKHSLIEISSLTWHKKNLQFSSSMLTYMSRKTVELILKAHLDGENNDIRLVEGSLERFASAGNFFHENAKIPSYTVLVNDNGFYEIMDGNHRISSAIALTNDGVFELPAWIGEIENRQATCCGW